MKTNDIYLAAAIISYGVVLERVDNKVPRRKFFFFSDAVKNAYILGDNGHIECLENVALERFEKLYMSKRVLLPPGYPEAIKHIKAIIFSDR